MRFEQLILHPVYELEMLCRPSRRRLPRAPRISWASLFERKFNKERKNTLRGQKEVLKFFLPTLRERNSISHRLPFTLNCECLMKLLIVCPRPLHFFPAHRSRPVRLRHLDTRGARLRGVGDDLGHLLILHRRVHPDRRLRPGAHYELPRLLLSAHGAWCRTACCEYFNVNGNKGFRLRRRFLTDR